MANSHTARSRSPVLWLLFALAGRISRRTFWASLAALYCINVALYRQLVVTPEEELQGAFLLILLIIAVSAFYISVAVSVKRLHDIGYSGFLAIAVAIPLINLAFWIWVGLLPGTAGPNPYGEATDQPPP